VRLPEPHSNDTARFRESAEFSLQHSRNSDQEHWQAESVEEEAIHPTNEVCASCRKHAGSKAFFFF
jgi:hypothetical protein